MVPMRFLGPFPHDDTQPTVSFSSPPTNLPHLVIHNIPAPGIAFVSGLQLGSCPDNIDAASCFVISYGVCDSGSRMMWIPASDFFDSMQDIDSPDC